MKICPMCETEQEGFVDFNQGVDKTLCLNCSVTLELLRGRGVHSKRLRDLIWCMVQMQSEKDKIEIMEECLRE